MRAFVCIALFALALASAKETKETPKNKRQLYGYGQTLLHGSSDLIHHDLGHAQTYSSGISGIGAQSYGIGAQTYGLGSAQTYGLGSAQTYGQSYGLGHTYGIGAAQTYTSGVAQALPVTYSSLPGTQYLPALKTEYHAPATQNVQYRTVEVKVPYDVPQPYQVVHTKQVSVPQPYPVYVTKTVNVPVTVKVPVDVPKPYHVKVDKPYPVYVKYQVPVEVPKPYPVYHTKTVQVPVEKQVYVKVATPVQVPVPQPYPVEVPKPVEVRVPKPVYVKEQIVRHHYAQSHENHGVLDHGVSHYSTGLAGLNTAYSTGISGLNQYSTGVYGSALQSGGLQSYSSLPVSYGSGYGSFIGSRFDSAPLVQSDGFSGFRGVSAGTVSDLGVTPVSAVTTSPVIVSSTASPIVSSVSYDPFVSSTVSPLLK